MQRQTLSGDWSFRQVGSDEWLPAVVPGDVHLDLLATGRILDPFLLDNEQKVQWVALSDWQYRLSFMIDPRLLEEDRICLACDGLDTLADVHLNGNLLGSTENMFRQYCWQVKSLLQPGENILEIDFHSPVRYIRERYTERPLLGVEETIPGGQYLRKAPSHFGWDWGPKLPAIGIWRDIRLEAASIARLQDVHLRQQHLNRYVTLSANVIVETWQNDSLSITMRVTSPDGEVFEAFTPVVDGQAQLSILIREPRLWWPNGYGLQPLYGVEIFLIHRDRLLDKKTLRTGLRTIELRHQPDEWGESFYFIVNGLPIFCKGANWIPPDSFLTRVTPEKLDHLITSARSVHMNMLRVWGGGTYESEEFYDLCDRYGILVWQDFMFACSVYPLDDPNLVENIHQEVIETVRRLRHRACLGLWCGNNEIDTAWENWGWFRPDTIELRQLDLQFFHYTLPHWVVKEDPGTAYWPSSPTSGTPPQSPNGGMSGDIHQWDVWHALKPFSNYKHTPARFVSEFGFQSLPAFDTITHFAPPEEWNLTSYMMEYHQRNKGGNGRLATYLTNYFRLPKDFDSTVYLSQLLQAEAMRVGVEHWRRERARTGGTLYWQLNDCWPVNSWSSIDYEGRLKAAHYAARHFFDPVLLSIDPLIGHFDVFITSDIVVPLEFEVRWSLETLRGKVMRSGAHPVTVTPFSTTPVTSIKLEPEPEAYRRNMLLVSELWQEGDLREIKVVPLVPDKHLLLEDPRIEFEGRRDGPYLIIHLKSFSLARFVELSIRGAASTFSDNYFDLPAGRSKTIACSIPAGWSAEEALNSLRIRSLIDTF